MDGFTFVEGLFKSLTGMIGALAWPAAIFGTVWLFRQKVNELLPLLILKHKDWQMSFGQELAAAEKVVDALPKQAPSENDAKKSADEESRLVKLARISPKAAILIAYEEIEVALLELARATGLIKGDKRLPILNLLILLRQHGMIDVQTGNALTDLRAIRNKVSHNVSEPDEEEVLRYVALSISLTTQLSIAARAASMPPPGPIPPGQP